MAHLKIVIAGLVVLALCLLFWHPSRGLLKKLLCTTLWAACALTAGSGAIVISDARGSLTALVGGVLLLGFSAYAAMTAKALGTK